jgi:hypothetical protein
MRLSISIDLADRCRTGPLPATLHNRSVEEPFPAANHPLAAFVAHLVATFQRFPQTRTQRRREQAEVSRSYTRRRLIRPERPTLDRSI